MSISVSLLNTGAELNLASVKPVGICHQLWLGWDFTSAEFQ